MTDVAAPDFAVYSADRQLQLVVEVKSTPKTDLAWAMKMRRNLLQHQVLPTAPYFLLALPDHLYLWASGGEDVTRQPDFQADTRDVLQRYMPPGAGSAQQILSGPALEWLIGSWLNDLTQGVPDPSDALHPETDWLRASGLPERVRTGVVHAETSAS